MSDYSLEYTSLLSTSQLEGDSDSNVRYRTLRSRIRYYIPSLSWLPNYSFNSFCYDFLAGISVACLLIPQGLSFSAELAHLPPVYGLYTALIPGIVYTFFGTSAQLSMGPEALVSIMIGDLFFQNKLSVIHNLEPEHAYTILAFITLVVGILSLTLGILRLGFLDSIISRPLLRGFISGVSLKIISTQLMPILGLDNSHFSESTGVLQQLGYILDHLSNIHLPTFLLSVMTLTYLFLFYYIKKIQPQKPLVALFPDLFIYMALITYFSYQFEFEKLGIHIFGQIENPVLPQFKMPDFRYLSKDFHQKMEVFISASLMAVLGIIESIIIGKEFSVKNGQPFSPNRDLIALGMANFFGAFFQAYPSFGSLSRSKVNDRSKNKTPLSGFITSLVVIPSIIYLLPYLYYLPRCVMSSVIIFAAYSLLSKTPSDLRFAYRLSAWKEILLLSITFLATFLISIDGGILVAVSLSLLLVIQKTTMPRMTILGRTTDSSDQFKPIPEFPNETEHIEGTLIVKIEEPLYFANTGQLKDRLRRLELFGDMRAHPSEDARLPPIAAIIFDTENMPFIDASGLYIFKEIILEYLNRGVQVYFVRLKPNVLEQFRKIDLVELIGGSKHFLSSISLALAHLENSSLITL